MVLNKDDLSTDTALTVRLAVLLNKPHLIVPLRTQDSAANASRVCTCCAENKINVLNVAGSGERKRPGIYDCALGFLLAVFSGAG